MDYGEHSLVPVAGGGFGDVWKGKLINGEQVAIKCLRFTTIVEERSKGLKRLMRETYNWSKARHENVQQLLGITILQERLGMVSLWREHGDLQGYIRNNPSADRYKLVSARSIHGSLHADLFAMNVLVSAEGVAKLSDFDHSILSNCTLAFSATTNPNGGTLRWKAPELLLVEDGEPDVLKTVQSDIYALGMEIITGKVPYAEYTKEGSIYRAVDRMQLPARPQVLMDQTMQSTGMWNLLVECWNQLPSARPGAGTILKRVRQ
ncbi:kinase-like protein [Ceratobasidium sp. AG-I]|nr:kinase-like protein [Ceratobasidium sp. AG-I]